MEWSRFEQNQADKIVARVDEDGGSRRTTPHAREVLLTLHEAERLKSNLSHPKNSGALLVRHLFKVLGFDERRVLDLRVEHKLVQAHLLHHYCPGIAPVTVGAKRQLSGLTRPEVDRRLLQLYDDGFFVKPSLGFASGDALSVDRKADFLLTISDGVVEATTDALTDEEFIIQKRIDVREEYRVHSIEDLVIPELTYLRYSPEKTSAGQRNLPNSFVNEILGQLPSGLVRDTLYGWDIAIDNSGNLAVIEVNCSGLHPVFNRGFQCSGFFQTAGWQIHCLERFVAFVCESYGVEIDIEAPSRPTDEFSSTYWLVSIYQQIRRAFTSLGGATERTKIGRNIVTRINNQLSAEKNTLLWVLAEALSPECREAEVDRDNRKLAGQLCEAGGNSLESEQGARSGEELGQDLSHSATHTEMRGRQNELNSLGEFASASLPMQSAERDEVFFSQLLGDVNEPTAVFGLSSTLGHPSIMKEGFIRLEASLVRSLRGVVDVLGTTVDSLCHLAWGLILAITSGRDDVTFGSVWFGSESGYPDLAQALLPKVNILPVRLKLGQHDTAAVLRRMDILLKDLKSHGNASLALVRQCSAVPVALELFSSAFSYRRIASGAGTLSNEITQTWRDIIDFNDEYTHCSVVLSVEDYDDNVRLTATAPSSLDPLRICEFMKTALSSLIEALETKSCAPALTIDVLPADERRRVLYEWNNTDCEFPQGKCIHELFEDQVRETPNATAITFRNKSLSYKELNHYANEVANFLGGLGVRPDVHVALCVERGVEMIVGLLAILKAGGAYVPLDPSYPMERLRFMLEDSKPVAVLSQAHLLGTLSALTATVPVYDMSSLMPLAGDLAEDNRNIRAIGLTPQHLAYTIYTSGSTGRPKGVMVPHGAVVNLLFFAQKEFRLTPRDSVLALASFSFDMSVLEIFLPLVVGSSLNIISSEDSASGVDFLRKCDGGGLFMQGPPARWKTLLAADWSGNIELKAICGGEALDLDLAKELIERTGAIWNMYGPTETTVWSLCKRLSRSDSMISIGKPIANTQVYILDAYGEPAAIGVAGEVYIGGAGVARGYLNQPELSADRFLNNPFSSDTAARVYKTGDLGRWLPDGEIEFLGRKDFQVKVNGFRIELGEIEACLNECPGIRESVVVSREDSRGDRRIVAYYTVREAHDLLDARSVAAMFNSYLSRKLPRYMIPSAFIPLDCLPLNRNGKVDRNALPAPQEVFKNDRALDISMTHTERTLYDIWSDLFPDVSVGPDDTLFSLGGDSLHAIRCTNKVRSEFNVEIPIAWLFSANASVRALAALIDDLRGS